MSEEAVNEAEKLEQSSSMTHLPEQSFEACRSRDSTYRREQATARVTTALSLGGLLLQRINPNLNPSSGFGHFRKTQQLSREAARVVVARLHWFSLQQRHCSRSRRRTRRRSSLKKKKKS
jgi:hypothetical protein